MTFRTYTLKLYNAGLLLLVLSQHPTPGDCGPSSTGNDILKCIRLIQAIANSSAFAEKAARSLLQLTCRSGIQIPEL